MNRLAFVLILAAAVVVVLGDLQCTLPAYAQGTVARVTVAEVDPANPNIGFEVFSIFTSSDEGGATFIAGYFFTDGGGPDVDVNFYGNCGVTRLTQLESVEAIGMLTKYACNGTCLWVKTFQELGRPVDSGGSVVLESVRVGHDRGIYVSGEMTCLKSGQNVTFANLTWSSPNPEACAVYETAFVMKFNSDATAVIWYYFVDQPRSAPSPQTAAGLNTHTYAMKMDGRDDVYWMFQSQTGEAFYLAPNSTSNYTRISTTWGVSYDARDCVVVKMSGADGAVRWWNVFGTSRSLDDGTVLQCTDLDVALDGVRGSLLHLTDSSGADILYPCGVPSLPTNSQLTMRITTFNASNGQCVATVGIGNGGLGLQPRAIAYSPQTSDAVYVQFYVNGGAACPIVPPLPAARCFKSTQSGFVVKLSSVGLRGIWITSFTTSTADSDGSNDVIMNYNGMDADGFNGLLVTGIASLGGSSTLCTNANVYCNASNAIAQFTPGADFVMFAAKLSTRDGSLAWISVYEMHQFDVPRMAVSAYGTEGYGMWVLSTAGYSADVYRNRTVTFGGSFPYSPQTDTIRSFMPLVFHADNQHGVSATMAQVCSSCMHLYDPGTPTCNTISYEGNVTWASVASGTNLDTDQVDIQASYMHTDGNVYVAGRITAAATGNLDFGGDCGLVGVGLFGNPFIAKYDSCTGRCLTINAFYTQSVGSVTSIKLARDGRIYISGITDCLSTDTTVMCPDVSQAGLGICITGNVDWACSNSTSNRYISWIYAIEADGMTAMWREWVRNSVTSVLTRELQLDNTSPVQTVYWMTQQTAGPGPSGDGILVSAQAGRNPGGNIWASGQPVDCVLWAFNTITGEMGNSAAFGDGDSSHLKECRSMAVTADGTRVAIAMTTSGAAVTLQPCGVDYAGGKGVDTRVVYINAANFHCINTTVFSSGGVFSDSPWRLAFGMYGSLFIVGETDHTDPGVGMTFPPLPPLYQSHQRDGWIARLDYSVAASNFSGVWAHSISSDGEDTCLGVAADGHFGVGVTGIYGSTNLCLDPTRTDGMCDSASSFASSTVNNTHVFTIKFDAVSGAKIWHRLYTTNITSAITTRSLSIAAFARTGYGFWTVTGAGRQLQQSSYSFGGTEVVYTPSTSNLTFGFVTKHADTFFGFSNESLADGCSSTPCQHGATCSVAYFDTATPICTCVAGYSGVFCQTDVNECESSPCTDGTLCVDVVNGYYCTYCVSSPCQNGGTCVTLRPLPDYTCTCAAGYSGPVCQTSIDECESSPCQNGGTCTDAVNRYACACAPGYSGVLCQTNVDECESSPCQNGGTCTDDVNRQSCSCPGGYSGVLCETDINECASSPCLNSGTCTDGVNAYTCGCAAGYSGPVCQTDIDECASSPCRNSGTCTDALNRYSCGCVAGYSGQLCQSNINECTSTPCQHGGTCTDDVNRYACVCAAGYSSAFCETDIDECASSPCLNSGTCTDGTNRYTCVCVAGYSGATCQTDVDECASTPCHNGGTCTDSLNRYSCSCAGGYSGVFCETNVDECASSPCINGGTCVDGVNAHVCTCVSGYSGKLCQTEIDECASSPCLHGGSCEGAVNGYSCHCLPGYSGVQCQTDIDECASSPCLHGATCSDGVNSYGCVCVSGYSGVQCQTDIDECASSPCRNSGTCVDAVNRLSCTCAVGYSGTLCQTNIDECASTPCRNSGTCTDAVNSFACVCVAGYSGAVCQTNVNECGSSPCYNGGSCSDAVNRFSCTCVAGYSGPFCQTNIDECVSHPCRNAATCYDMVNSFFCACPSGYTGVSCQTDINECATANGGCDTRTTCSNTPAGSRTCGDCPAGYTGTGDTTCFLLSAPCGSTPCQNGGTCAPDGVNDFTCECPVQFTGSICQTDVNECTAMNGGCDPLTNCTNISGSFGCGPCPFGYTGTGLVGCTDVDSACESAPCQNGAMCNSIAINVMYNCTCATGFVGAQCQTDINECATSSGGCDSLTLCVNTLGSRLCSACPSGYHGTGATVCIQDTNECASTPCQHGGTCNDGDELFTCTCVAGYSGRVCQVNIDECASNPCFNGGTCADAVNHFTCACDDTSFTGLMCETGLVACASLPCQNGGVCSTTGDGGTNYTCACVPGYGGSVCQTDIDECASVPCQNGGNCTDLVNGVTCNCTNTPGNGTFCEHSDCDSSPCMFGGICTARLVINSTLDNSTFTCTCLDSYHVGARCADFDAAVPIELRKDVVPRALALVHAIVISFIAIASISIVVWYFVT